MVDSDGINEARNCTGPSAETKPKQVGGIKPEPRNHSQEQVVTLGEGIHSPFPWLVLQF